MTKTRPVLVTGATGRVGGQVVAHLSADGVLVRALARDPDAAAVALGDSVEVVGGDLAEPHSLTAALDAVAAVFLVFPSVTADHAARELVRTLTKHVRRIVYLSSNGVPDEPDTHAEPDGTILGSHAHLEGLLAASAQDVTFLRPSGFAANVLGWADQLRRSDVLRWFHPAARRAPIHEADLGAVGVRTLVEDGHERRAYHVTGPDQFTQLEQLDAIGTASGRSLRFEELTADEAATTLFPEMPRDVVASIVDAHRVMVSNPEQVTDTVERLTGRPALPFAGWARDHAAEFARRAA